MSPVPAYRAARSTHGAAYLDQDHGCAIVRLVGTFCFLAVTLVCLRFHVRTFMIKALGPDDWTMLVTTLLSVATWVCFIGETYHGLGRHFEVITLGMEESLLKWQFAHNLFSLFGMCTVKISIALLLVRVCHKRSYHRFLYGLIAFVAVYTLICAGTLIFDCNPISASWDLAELSTAKCLSLKVYNALAVANSAFNMTIDATLATLPIPIIWTLKLNQRTKMALSIVVALGYISVICGAVKTHYQWQYEANKDRLYHDDFFVWASLETNTGIIAASLPTLKPLVVATRNFYRHKCLGYPMTGTNALSKATRRSTKRPSHQHTDWSSSADDTRHTRMLQRPRSVLTSVTTWRERMAKEPGTMIVPRPDCDLRTQRTRSFVVPRPDYDLRTECSRSSMIIGDAWSEHESQWMMSKDPIVGSPASTSKAGSVLGSITGGRGRRRSRASTVHGTDLYGGILRTRQIDRTEEIRAVPVAAVPLTQAPGINYMCPP